MTVTPGLHVWQSSDLNTLVLPNCNCISRQVSIHNLFSIFTGQLLYIWPSANMLSTFCSSKSFSLQQGCKEKNASPICTMRMKEKVYFPRSRGVYSCCGCGALEREGVWTGLGGGVKGNSDGQFESVQRIGSFEHSFQRTGSKTANILSTAKHRGKMRFL